ncbi:TonB-dependent receptor [Sphingosinicella sp. LHD-64]|uniref:TonB-dependent receptor plug domain-containing protein n=1 Tax=Sphingosinicella sp. LHD-64 TaxID=3072139 RepID=UPI00280EC9B4|nr:TonB-dependent receptor [Sphingosinicella sp. LHD-64]MDQ8757709.1 TonB-dependent receptor [Sphingosinicella sp. LHD-64]
MKVALGPSVMAMALMGAGAAQAQTVPAQPEPAPEAGTELAASDEGPGEIVVIGSRRANRSVLESTVPIDILQPEALERSGYTDLNDSLRSLVPSFNAQRLPLNDGSSFVRPVTLRSSPADHVLLLMNGRRRHRSAIVQIGTGHATTSGSQGQDFNAIPPIAFERVEVLRDGAAAQYGSDAIAGVINLALRDDNEGGTLAAQMGQYYEGDGYTIDLQGNIGLPLTRSGFLNVSGQFTRQDKTFRGGPVAGAEALRAQGVQGVPRYPAELGEPFYRAYKLVWNSGIELGSDVNAYMFGNYMQSDSTVGFSYRQSRAAGGFPAHVSFGNSIYDGTPAHPEIFDLTRIYPGGYVPQFSGRLTDFSTVAGVKYDDGRFTFDLGGRIGVSKVRYRLDNSINPSLGVNSPTSFRPGSLLQREVEGTAEASYQFSDSILLFGGVSYRRETYEIGVGDPASYAVGPLRDLPVGSNGFQGFTPDIAGSFSTDSYAAFIELDVDVTDRWEVQVAGRYEDYAAFGDNFSYKVATRYELADAVAIRGAVSTGFRAPAAGQLFGTSQTSQISPVTNDFILDAVLIPGSPAAQVFGSTPLVPETSFNISAGIVVNTGGFTATLDFYQIDVDDRLLLTPPITTTAAQRAALVALGFPNGASVQQVRFFQNKLDTRVRGFDLVGTYRLRWNDSNTTELSAAINYNEQILRSDPTGFFDAGTVQEFERGTPRWRANLTATHQVGDFELTARGVYYGPWRRRAGTTFLPREGVMLVDLEVTYHALENVDVNVGARNLFNILPPDRGPAIRALGIIHDNHSPFGLSGGYYYAGLRYRF